ncbi:hypothetical protein BC941DRAFT_515970 [Chlamydoabsidia padenii]|nr:hypothetical protein BC941DRAFT_515970 [Chlamydoabsidia padenii]
MHMYVKHATLINNCYPEGEGVSRSSELSYLTFYASSRPIKLTKVGLFLEKKVERDMIRGRKKHLIVSLEILQSLIQACHRDLNLFSKHIVNILVMVLGMKDKDIELFDKACETFADFANYHDGNTLGVDVEFTADYEILMQQFAGYCSYQGKDETLTSRVELMGHRGLQACVISPAFESPNLKTQLGIIMPPIIATLAESKQPVNSLLKGKKTSDLKQMVKTSDLMDAAMVFRVAAKTATLLFGKINGTGIRLALGTLLNYLDSNEKWWPPNFAVASVELVLDSLQAQYRYHLVTEILQQIENTTYQTFTDKQASLISILDTVLNAALPLSGISVLEVLNSLFGHLIKSLEGVHEFRVDKPSLFEGKQATLAYTVHYGLAHSIAGLASHTYYQNQLDDITNFMLAKLRVGTTLKQVEGLPLVNYRNVVLKCLDMIVGDKHSSPSGSDELLSSSSCATISLESWIPAFGLLIDSEPKTRIDFSMTLVRYLITNAANDLNVGPFPKHTLNRYGDMMFINGLQQYVLQMVSMNECNTKDVQVLYYLLCALTRCFGVDGTTKMMPLVFQLQKLVEQKDIVSTAKQRALATAIVEYFDMVGQFYHVDRLVHYVNQVRTERLQNKEYSTVTFDAKTPSSDSYSFDDLEPENNNPATIFLNRRVVVEILSKDSHLRDEEDTYGLDLENKLSMEWGSEALANQGRSCKIRTTRNLGNVKPRLSTPWINTDLVQTTKSQQQTVRVETLKEALASTKLDTQEVETYYGDLDGTLASNSLKKLDKDTQSKISSLLAGLNVGSVQPTSLVNPPYQF